MTYDLTGDAQRVRDELHVAAKFVPAGEARATLNEAARLLHELAGVAGERDRLQADLARAQRLRAELEDALGQERAWLPSGLYLLRREEGSVSRTWVARAQDEDLEALLPRAALLRHREAVTRAVMAVYEEVRASVVRDEEGVPTRLTWPAGARVADLILAEIQCDLPAYVISGSETEITPPAVSPGEHKKGSEHDG